jgi:hypothetical protein
MTFPIGPRPVATQQPQLTVPGSNASAEAHAALTQSLSALGKHDRHECLHGEFVGAAGRGDRRTISELNPMLGGRDPVVLSEALLAAAANGHFEIMRMIFKGRAWLWADNKFSVMACIVEHYDPSSLEHRKTLMDLFGHISGERRSVRLHNSQAEYAEYEARVAKILIGVREKDPELANWCDGQWQMAGITLVERSSLI